MSSYATSLKTTRMQAVINAIDAGAAAGYIEIYTAGFAALLVTIMLADPSFTEAAGTITMAGVPKSGVASGGGTAAAARIKDSNGTVIVNNMTVGTSGQEIELDSVAITAGKTVTITAGTITHA